MLKDITLGQFFPGDSLIHKLDPRVKLILTIVYIAIIFTAKTAASYIAVALIAVCLIAVSRISAVTILKSLKPILFIMVFTAVMNIFWTKGEEVLFSFWKITVYREGVIFALFMVVGRILSGVHWISDIIGGALLSAGLVMLYSAVVEMEFKL